MSTFTISKWFEVSADSYEDAWEIAEGKLEVLVALSEDSGTIDVEEVEE